MFYENLPNNHRDLVIDSVVAHEEYERVFCILGATRPLMYLLRQVTPTL
jgi:hypothetical protein